MYIDFKYASGNIEPFDSFFYKKDSNKIEKKWQFSTVYGIVDSN